MSDLKDLSTKQLVEELNTRMGVQMFRNKLYQSGYSVQIIKKYSSDRTPAQLPVNFTLLVINDDQPDRD